MSEHLLSSGINIRAATLEDIEGLQELFNVYEIMLHGTAGPSQKYIRHLLQGFGDNLKADTWLVQSPKKQVIGFAFVVQLHHVKIYFDVIVHPEYNGRHIDIVLLHRIEERIRQLTTAAESGAQLTLHTQVSDCNLVWQRSLVQHGFREVRRWWHMKIDLQEETPAPQWSDGIHLMTIKPEMKQMVYEAFIETFQDRWGFIAPEYEEWQRDTVQRDDFDPSLWFLAMDGEQVAGFAFCRGGGKGQVGIVDKLGVRCPWRRRGIALALLHTVFREFYRRGTHTVILGVDSQSETGAVQLYQRVGMWMEKETISYEKEIRR